MLRSIEAGQNLIVDYPAWAGLLMLGLGVALAIHMVRRIDLTARSFGIIAASALLLFGGIYFITYKVTFTPDAATVYAFPGGNQRIDWSHVVSMETEQRRGRGLSTWIVVRSAGGGALEINVSGLSGVEEKRVRDYIAGRMNK